VSADPTAGDPADIRRVARALEDRADDVRIGGHRIREATAEAGSGWDGTAQRAFLRTADPVPATASRVADRLDEAADALRAYATAVERIQAEAHRITTAQSSAATDAHRAAARIHTQRAVVRGPDAVESDEAHLRSLQSDAEHIDARIARLDADWDDLVARRDAADTRAAAALESPAVIGRPVTARAVATMSNAEFLEYLAGLDREQVLALDPDGAVAERLADMDADDVASWWHEMTGPDGNLLHLQDAFITALPAVIGNLEGVSYAARAKANALRLPIAIVEAERQIRRLQDILRRASTDGARQAAFDQLDDWQTKLDGYRAIQRATASGLLSLISLVPDTPPLAQLAAGNLDTAGHVSYIIPGMNTATSVPGTVARHAKAAQQLQRTMALTGDTALSDIAVVAWLGYHPPMQDLSAPTVAGNGRAEAGADRLVTTIDGFHATRHASGRAADLSVIAHSYGTTTATIALTRVHADHVVLIGSAGIDPTTVPNASAMMVPKGEVFATQGAKDAWAITGQALSFRTDPTDPSFGAHDFGSEAATVDGHALDAVDQHGPFGEGGRKSYLDGGTTAQYRAAQAMMGQGASIPVEGTPDDRIATNRADGDLGLLAWQIQPWAGPGPHLP
jgi:uncharacterized protein YukE